MNKNRAETLAKLHFAQWLKDCAAGELVPVFVIAQGIGNSWGKTGVMSTLPLNRPAEVVAFLRATADSLEAQMNTSKTAIFSDIAPKKEGE